ncbi:flagella synthesis protein FlgN [Acidihalobacter yilgarnensis]|nr:flagellar protein FlgN [Acidihalobacter yilgarnensis]
MSNDESMLLSILGEEFAAMTRLREILETESDALERLQVEALLSLADAKQALIQSLEASGERRAALLAGLGYGADPVGMDRYLSIAPAEVAAAWRVLVDETTRCEALNRRNGALNNSGQRQVRRLLRVLRGEPVEPATYDRKGDSGIGGGQPLAKV